MIFSVAHVIWYLSQFMVLHPATSSTRARRPALRSAFRARPTSVRATPSSSRSTALAARASRWCRHERRGVRRPRRRRHRRGIRNRPRNRGALAARGARSPCSTATSSACPTSSSGSSPMCPTVLGRAGHRGDRRTIRRHRHPREQRRHQRDRHRRGERRRRLGARPRHQRRRHGPGHRGGAAIPARSDAAAVVNLSSIAALNGLPQRALYSASKGAVMALTYAMATDHVTRASA